MNSGLYALAGASATATAAAWANLLLEPMTNVSNVYLGFSRAWAGRGAPGAGPGAEPSPPGRPPPRPGPSGRSPPRFAARPNSPAPAPNSSPGSAVCSAGGPARFGRPDGAWLVSGAATVGSTVTASWMLRPSSRDSVL